jgi:hypothetical protein
MNTYNHNLSRKANEAAAIAEEQAKAMFTAKAETYEEAKQAAVTVSVKGYTFELWPAHSFMVDGIDYGDNEASAILVPAMLVG